LAAYSSTTPSYGNQFVIFSTERTQKLFSLPSSTVDRNFIIIITINSLQKFFLLVSQLVIGNVTPIFRIASDLGNPL